MNTDQIAMCCISMDFSQQAPQTTGKIFSNFNLVFKILAKKQKFGKLKNIQKNIKEWILIKLQCVIYQWIHLNELSLQTNEKLF